MSEKTIPSEKKSLPEKCATAPDSYDNKLATNKRSNAELMEVEETEFKSFGSINKSRDIKLLSSYTAEEIAAAKADIEKVKRLFHKWISQEIIPESQTSSTEDSEPFKSTEKLKKARVFQDAVRFEESIKTFIKETNFSLDPNSECLPDGASAYQESSACRSFLYEFWTQVREDISKMHQQVRSIVPQSGPDCPLSLEEVQVCLDYIEECINKMSNHRDACRKELKKWWSLTQVLDSVFCLEVSVSKIFSEVKNLESNKKNSEGNSDETEFSRKNINHTLDYKAKPSDSNPSNDVIPDVEMKSLPVEEKSELSGTSMTSIQDSSSKTDSSLSEPSKKLEKPSGDTLKSVKESCTSEDKDENLAEDVPIVTTSLSNRTTIDYLETINLYPSLLKFEQTIEAFLNAKKDFVSNSEEGFTLADSNPMLVEIWENAEGIVFDFRRQVQTISSELGPSCKLSTEDLTTYALNLKNLADKVKDYQQVCLEELAKWWTLTQVLYNAVILEASLNVVYRV